MPIYDYHCDHCGHTFSAVQSYTDATLERCPSCGKRPRKLMAMPAIVFKGGGWYKTDSRPAQKDGGESKPGEAATDAAQKPGSDAKPAGESKPAADAKPATDMKRAGGTKSGGSSKADAAS
ncbi:MAG TPA: FmdB family zinc ribbon protein [Candidatus Saccharimonadales bacterium]|nr:FmdB family zinc ribbon protein [Candidatus Saccharimonadales bacterium]